MAALPVQCGRLAPDRQRPRGVAVCNEARLGPVRPPTLRRPKLNISNRPHRTDPNLGDRATLGRPWRTYLNSDNTFCGIWLAWLNIAVPACCKIWPRVSLAVSDAKSVSMIRPRAADRLLLCESRFETTCSSLLWPAPTEARRFDTLSICV